MKLEMKLPCPKSEAIESYEILLAVCRAEDTHLAVGYKQMRDLLERICRAQMQNESLQMTDLSARISLWRLRSVSLLQSRTGCILSGSLRMLS